MKAPARWLEDPEALPNELIASMQAHTDLGPSERELARIRVGVRLSASKAPGGLKWLGVLSVLAGLGAAVWSMRAPPARKEAPRAAPIVAAPPTAQPTVVVEPTPSVVPEPSVVPKPLVRARRPPARVLPEAPAADATAELALLRRARRVLASDPSAALGLTNEHLRSYPDGMFAEERELLAIEALSQRDRAAAIERARAFANKYPRSVHQPRIEAALGAR